MVSVIIVYLLYIIMSGLRYINLFIVPSGSPVNVQARTVDSTTIELQWELPLPGERNGIVIFFQVNVTATETKSTLIVNSTNDMMNITSLHPHYHYSLAVAATTSKRVGPYSQPVTAITFEDGKDYLHLLQM